MGGSGQEGSFDNPRETSCHRWCVYLCLRDKKEESLVFDLQWTNIKSKKEKSKRKLLSIKGNRQQIKCWNITGSKQGLVIDRAPMHLGKMHICGVKYHYPLLEGIWVGKGGFSLRAEGRDEGCHWNEFLEIKAQNIPSLKKETLRLMPHVLFFDGVKALTLRANATCLARDLRLKLHTIPAACHI